METLAIIVNYKSSALTQQAVKSVLESQSLGPVTVVVVDNSAEPEEAERLGSGLPSPVTLQINDSNKGFASACNQAFEAFDSDAILLINPDARLLPGSLRQLQKTLFSRRCVAAVSPQLFWDDGQVFHLPPPYPIALFEFRTLLSAWGSKAWMNRFISLLWRRRSLKLWRSQKPVALGNLSGGLVLLDRKAVQKAGGLFDPRFFLYFEDTDLFVRLRDEGFRILVEPRARAIHYYDQCGQGQWAEKRELMAKSQDLFVEKHKKAWSRTLKRVLECLPRPVMGPEKFNSPVFQKPFSLSVPTSIRKQWLFEWSPNPDMIPSAGRFGTGPEMRFPQTCWRSFSPGQYFGRLGGTKMFGTSFQQISWIVQASS